MDGGELAEVRPADFVVRHDLSGPALRDEPAEVEDVEPGCEGLDHFDVVLDEQHRGAALALHLLERADHLPRLVLVEPGRRLVEQQERGFGHQRSPELDEAAAPETQRIDRPIRDILQPEQLERLVDSLTLLGGGLGEVEAVPPEAPGAEPGPLADLQVVANAHAAEQLDPLEGAAQPESGALVHRRAG